MNLNTLSPAAGSVRSNYRRGRGQGSGGGGTATRGHKGAKSRSGYSSKKGFEGGQMPLQRRVPKFGFKNINRVEYCTINLDMIQSIAESKNITDFNVDVYIKNGVSSKTDLVKVLGRGELKSKVNVTAHAISETAKAAIEAKGGSVTIITKLSKV
jgi:large subunit ribosomal protein L15